MALAGIHVEVDDESVLLFAPYHPAIPPAARRIGGRWTGEAWRFDARDEMDARELARAVYGTDGDDNAEIVDVRFTIAEPVRALRGGVYFAGRVIARASGRDSGAWLGDGVLQVDGESPLSCGSARRWETMLQPGTYEIRDVPEPAIHTSEDRAASCEIVRRHARAGGAAE